VIRVHCGVAHQYVDRPELPARFGNQPFELIAFADVRRNRHRLAGRAGQLLVDRGCDRVARICLAARDHDARAVSGHFLGDRFTDPLSGSGDQRDFAGQVEQPARHHAIPSCCFA
jgi:hypothetical protein